MSVEFIVTPHECLCSLIGAYNKALKSSNTPVKEEVFDELSKIQEYQKNKLNIAFLGGYSAGKTTFISRVLGKLSATTSPVPETATLISHTASSKNLFRINFKKNYTDEKGTFEKLLKEFSLDSGFEEISTNNFSVVDDSHFLKENSRPEVLINFMSKSKEHTSAIDNIELLHYIGNKYSLLKYASLHDLPGIGGKEDHEEILRGVLNNLVDFDIIIYLIDTSRGAVDENELVFIERAFKLYGELIPNKMQWYWLYQKPTDIANNSKTGDTAFLFEAKDIIREVLKERLSDENIVEVFEKTNFISAFGDKDEHQEAEQAISLVIMDNIRRRIAHLLPALDFSKRQLKFKKFICPSDNSNFEISKFISDEINKYCKNIEDNRTTREALLGYLCSALCLEDISQMKGNHYIYAVKAREMFLGWLNSIVGKIVSYDTAIVSRPPKQKETTVLNTIGEVGARIPFLNMDKIKEYIGMVHLPSDYDEFPDEVIDKENVEDVKNAEIGVIDFNYLNYSLARELSSDIASNAFSLLYSFYFLYLHDTNEMASLYTDSILSGLYSSLRSNLSAFEHGVKNIKETVCIL